LAGSGTSKSFPAKFAGKGKMKNKKSKDKKILKDKAHYKKKTKKKEAPLRSGSSGHLTLKILKSASRSSFALDTKRS
jgi:hypothetical protein